MSHFIGFKTLDRKGVVLTDAHSNEEIKHTAGNPLRTASFSFLTRNDEAAGAEFDKSTGTLTPRKRRPAASEDAKSDARYSQVAAPAHMTKPARSVSEAVIVGDKDRGGPSKDRVAVKPLPKLIETIVKTDFEQDNHGEYLRHRGKLTKSGDVE